MPEFCLKKPGLDAYQQMKNQFESLVITLIERLLLYAELFTS